MSIEAPWEKKATAEEKDLLGRLLNSTASVEDILGPAGVAPAVVPAVPPAPASAVVAPSDPILPPQATAVQHNVGAITRYAELFDQAVLDSAKERVAQYDHDKPGRYDPFDPAVLADQLQREIHSQLLGCKINTFVLACSHAVLMTEIWKSEDESLVNEHDRKVEKELKLQNIEEARAAWKKAIVEAKEGKRKWDLYVAEMKRRFQVARDG